jgi:major vault protein
LVTIKDAETHIPDVNEVVVGEVPITTLTSRQYAFVLDPVDQKSGKNQLGIRELRKGELSFFLRPGERLESGIQNIHVLEEDEALLLRAREAFKDGEKIHKPGDRWMIYGPTDYVPTVNVEVVEKRRAIPLDENEGVYVRDVKTGKVRSVTGQSYMLEPYEELWEKDLPDVVEQLLGKDATRDPAERKAATSKARDRTRVATYRIPHNSAVQVYDYTSKKARIVFGPDLVMLGPDEQFTILSLSGDVPKRPHVIKSLALLLGPDFMTDVVVVETSDHARLSLKVSYNWHFDYDRNNAATATKMFAVPDFVGDACKAIASRVRGIVAAHTFDNFHKNSASIIREAVFGKDEKGEIQNRFVFSQNNLVITNIDIQSVEPVDSRTRDALQKSVQLAIEITTKSQEAAARHEAERRDQQARGRLERQKIEDEGEAEKARISLLSLQAQSAAVESTGQATAEAKARAEAAAIEGAAAVKQAELQSEAELIKSEAKVAQKKAKQEAEIAHQTALDALEISKARDLAEIEASKFKSIVDALGAPTLEAIAQAGPEMQAKLLGGLGLQSFMLTGNDNPIGLFSSY